MTSPICGRSDFRVRALGGVSLFGNDLSFFDVVKSNAGARLPSAANLADLFLRFHSILFACGLELAIPTPG